MKMCKIFKSNRDPHLVYEKNIHFPTKNLQSSFFGDNTLTELARKNTDTDKYDKILLPYSILVQQQYITYT